jgi:hypothetical protein
MTKTEQSRLTAWRLRMLRAAGVLLQVGFGVKEYQTR